MPGFDRTGPMGLGPMTGGGFGLCNPGSSPTFGYGYPWRGAGRGFAPWGGGRGRVWGGGRGRGWRGYGYWGYPSPGYPPAVYEPPTKEQELEYLREQTALMEREMKAVQKRIKQLEAESEKK